MQHVIFRQDPNYVYSREAIVRRMPDGDLLCVWLSGGPREPDDTNVVPVVRSENDGRSWTEPEVLFSVPGKGTWCTELYVAEDHVFAFVGTYQAATRYHYLASHIAVSHDAGRTFSPLRALRGGWLESLADSGWLGGLNVRQGIRTISGKHVFAVCWYEPTRDLPDDYPVKINSDGAGGAFAHSHTFYCGLLETVDFESFRLHGRIQRRQDIPWSGPTPEVPLHEPNVVEVAPGRLVMLIRGEHSRTLWRADSADDGQTWTDAYPIDIPNHGSKLRYLRGPENEFILIHNPHPMHRNPLELWVSVDGMGSWPARVRVDPDEALTTTGRLQYPDGFVDEDADRLYFAWEDGRNIFLYAAHLEPLRSQARRGSRTA